MDRRGACGRYLHIMLRHQFFQHCLRHVNTTANAEGGEGAGGRVARAFIEDGATGDFYNLNDPGLWRRITKFFERKVRIIGGLHMYALCYIMNRLVQFVFINE